MPRNKGIDEIVNQKKGSKNTALTSDKDEQEAEVSDEDAEGTDDSEDLEDDKDKGWKSKFRKYFKQASVKKNKDGKGNTFIEATSAFLSIVICIFCILLLVDELRLGGIEPTYVDYATFTEQLEEGNIYAVYLSDSSTKIKYQLKADVSAENLERKPDEVQVWDYDKTKWYYTTYMAYEGFAEEVQAQNVPLFDGKFDPLTRKFLALFLSVGSTILFLGILLALISTMSSSMGGGQGQRFEVSKDTGVKFKDVIGHDEILTDLKQYITLLSKADVLKEKGITPPKGVLFTGPPGTGKTLIAKAMAGEGDIPFIYLNASNVIEMFVGVGAKTIRSVFKHAREIAPCVVFIDEIDAIGGKRGKRNATSEDTQTLTALLQELDGFKNMHNVLVIAATNTPDTLDSALKRAGRFDREIVISPPRNKTTRIALLTHYGEKVGLTDKDIISEFADQLGSGTTGADIASIVNEAALLAVTKETEITLDLLNESLDKLTLKGNKVRRKGIATDHRIVAYHEAGHAIMSYIQDEPISRISVVGTTSGVGGFVLNGDSESQFQTKEYLEKRLRILYGGRCTECITNGEQNVTTGAKSDIDQATNVISSMALEYGMLDKSATLNYSMMRDLGFAMETMPLKHITEYAERLEKETMALLEANYDLVKVVAEKLLEVETLTGSEVDELLADYTVKTLADITV